jgi:hypothetical protein
MLLGFLWGNAFVTGRLAWTYGMHVKKRSLDEEKPLSQWIGVRENLQESPRFNGKIDGFL